MKYFRRKSLVILLTTASGVSLFLVSLAYMPREEDNYSRIEDHMRKNHWTRDEALAFVRSKRSIVRPNPAFMRLLREWEGVVRGELAPSSSAMLLRCRHGISI